MILCAIRIFALCGMRHVLFNIMIYIYIYYYFFILFFIDNEVILIIPLEYKLIKMFLMNNYGTYTCKIATPKTWNGNISCHSKGVVETIKK